MISVDLSGMHIGWKRKTDFETRENLLRSRHRDGAGLPLMLASFSIPCSEVYRGIG
jgi:hypothetical protein